MFFGRIPRYGCITSNNFIKFSFNKKHGIGNIITNLMKLCSRESMIACSEKKCKFGRLFFKNWSDVLAFPGDNTIDLRSEIGCWEGSWCNWLSSEFFVNIVKLCDFFKCYLNLVINFLYLFFCKWRFENLILFHENLWKYLIHVYSRYFIKLSLVDHWDKRIHFLWVS